MLRRTPMKRTAFRKEGPVASKESRPAKPKPVKDATCSQCDKPFARKMPMQSVCGLKCAQRKAEGKLTTKEAAKLKARKEKLKTITEWEHECKAIVQKIARLRDKNDGCISCHMGPDYRGQWHGSHFRPAGNHSAVELHLWNIHKSCAQCNLHKAGNQAAYRPRLVAKIGVDRVEWLESQNQVTRRTVDYLKRFKKVMSKRLRRMEKTKK